MGSADRTQRRIFHFCNLPNSSALPLSDLSLTLGDPTLELHHRDDQGQDSIIATNDNWKQTQQAAIKATGKAPAHDSETATLQTLAPGNYTAILAGKNSTSGAGLVVGA